MCILFYREKEENKPTKPAKYVYGCLAEIAASVYSPLFTDWPVSDGLYQHMDRESWNFFSAPKIVASLITLSTLR